MLFQPVIRLIGEIAKVISKILNAQSPVRRVIASIGFAPNESVKNQNVYVVKGMRRTMNTTGLTKLPVFKFDTNSTYLCLIVFR